MYVTHAVMDTDVGAIYLGANRRVPRLHCCIREARVAQRPQTPTNRALDMVHRHPPMGLLSVASGRCDSAPFAVYPIIHAMEESTNSLSHAVRLCASIWPGAPTQLMLSPVWSVDVCCMNPKRMFVMLWCSWTWCKSPVAWPAECYPPRQSLTRLPSIKRHQADGGAGAARHHQNVPAGAFFRLLPVMLCLISQFHVSLPFIPETDGDLIARERGPRLADHG